MICILNTTDKGPLYGSHPEKKLEEKSFFFLLVLFLLQNQRHFQPRILSVIEINKTKLQKYPMSTPTLNDK